VRPLPLDPRDEREERARKTCVQVPVVQTDKSDRPHLAKTHTEYVPWLTQQSTSVQNTILGAKRAVEFRKTYARLVRIAAGIPL